MLLNDVKTGKVWFLNLHIVIANFLFSYSLGVFNTCAENVSATLDWGDSKDTYIAVFSSMVPVGALFGSTLVGPLSVKFGRRGALMITDVIFAVGCVLSVVPYTPSFAIGRFVCGVGAGLCMSLSPMLVNEVTPDSMTAQMGPMVQIANNSALIFAYGFGLMLPSSNYHSATLNELWMLMFLFPGALGMYQYFYFALSMKFDSPKWYLDKGEKEKAIEALKYVYYDSGIDKGLARFQEIEVNMSMSEKPASALTFTELFRNPKYKRMIRIGVLLGFIQQVSGINANIFYSTSTFKEIGGSTSIARIYTFIMGVVNFISGLLTLPLLKRYGRKTLLISGSVFMGIDLIVLGLFSGYVGGGGPLPIICINLYMFFFAYSLGTTLWAYLGEVCNDKALTLSAGVNLFFTCVITISFPFAVQAFGISISFFFFALALVFAVVYFHFDCIETKGKTKPEILNLVYN